MIRQLTLLLLIVFVKARITLELTWNTEEVSYTCCQNKNQLIRWNFTEAVNERVMELQWFFNETTLICLDSKVIGFHVETLYNSRVERNGTAGILLKNVSLTDTGKYTLYVKLAEEMKRNIQHMFLAVDEQVPYQCKPIIKLHPHNVMHCSTTCVEKSHLSPKWIINGTRDTVDIGPYLSTNAGINEHAFCCLHGLKCHDDDQFKSCMPNPIPSKVFMDDNRNMRQDESSTVKGANDDSNNTSNVLTITCVIIVALCFLVVLITAHFVWRRHQSVDDVKPKNSREGKDDLEKVDNVVGTADRSLNHSNSVQNIQIVNNISMDGDTVKFMVESQRLLMIDLEAAREENRVLKLQLPSYKHSKRLHARLTDKSKEMTELKCHHLSHNDTDKLEMSSDCEDASSVVEDTRMMACQTVNSDETYCTCTTKIEPYHEIKEPCSSE